MINKDHYEPEWVQRSLAPILINPEGFVSLSNGSDKKESKIIMQQ